MSCSHRDQGSESPRRLSGIEAESDERRSSVANRVIINISTTPEALVTVSGGLGYWRCDCESLVAHIALNMGWEWVKFSISERKVCTSTTDAIHPRSR